MEISCYVLLLVLIGLCDAYVLVANGTTHDEIHEFQWASHPDLSDANCAVAVIPPPPSNDTPKTGFWNMEFNQIIYGASSEEGRKVICSSFASLFRLVGNPGIIMHPASNQCVHAIPFDRPIYRNGLDPADTVANLTVLQTSYYCNRDHPTLAYFKYDKNKPQRLSYLGPVDKNTGTRQEWCIRNFYDGTIHVHPACYPFKYINEAFYHEFL